MRKKRLAFLFSILLVFLLMGCSAQPKQTTQADNAAIRFTDDLGRNIQLEQPCQTIISLYSAHTENLYMLGAGDSVIGVNSTAIIPADAASKTEYGYEDPEPIIAAHPDVVLLRPFIDRKYPDFVASLENAGLTVVSLYPERFTDFDSYIEKLGLLSGREAEAKQGLEIFHDSLLAITALTKDAKDKQTIFFESTDTNVRTVIGDSMPALAIQMAGGVNIAGDLPPISEGSSIAAFGSEKVLELAEEIDVYVSQRGSMNAGGNLHAISLRPGYKNIKAVKNGRVYEVNEKIISSPTLNYNKGVREIARYLYPEIMDSLDAYRTDQPADRRDFANILVRYTHEPIYIPSSSSYYDTEHQGHTYGMFADIDWKNPDFDAIETAATTGWIESEKTEGKEYFRADTKVTREMLARAIYLMRDYKKKDTHIAIKDLDACAVPEIVQTLVDNGVMPLEKGKFNPNRELTQNEILSILQSLEK